jgi:hypothetical protein
MCCVCVLFDLHQSQLNIHAQVILSLQEAIPVLPPRPSFIPSRLRPLLSKDDSKSKSNSFIIMPGTHILAR